MNILATPGLYLSEPEIWQIIVYYRDPNDKDRFCWRTFADDVDQGKPVYEQLPNSTTNYPYSSQTCTIYLFLVFTTKELEKWPEFAVEPFPNDVRELVQRGQVPWSDVQPGLRDTCEETIKKIQQKSERRRINLKPDFKAYDKCDFCELSICQTFLIFFSQLIHKYYYRLNTGYVSRAQYRQVLSSNNILLADEELTSLEMRFYDENGFNYFWFLTQVEAEILEEPLVSTSILLSRLLM